MAKKKKKKQSAEEKNKILEEKIQKFLSWSVFGVILLAILSLFIGGGGSGGVSCKLLDSKEYNNLVISCEYECYKEGKSKIFYYTPIPDNPPYCPGFPQYWSNEGRYKDVDDDFIF